MGVDRVCRGCAGVFRVRIQAYQGTIAYRCSSILPGPEHFCRVPPRIRRDRFSQLRRQKVSRNVSVFKPGTVRDANETEEMYWKRVLPVVSCVRRFPYCT